MKNKYIYEKQRYEKFLEKEVQRKKELASIKQFLLDSEIILPTLIKGKNEIKP
jgi:hypothetical protein